MTEHEASRTLVKSPPELWAELSDSESLAGHLAEPFGEIRITRLEPETAVAWEGERASGTVRIEPSGWGTRVTLTVRAGRAESPGPGGQPGPRGPEPAPDPPPAPAPDPPPMPAPDPLPPAATEPPAEPHAAEVSPGPRRGWRARLLGWLGRKPSAEDDPAPADEPAPGTRAPAAEPEAAPADPGAALVGILDRLGAAHRRPFSRS
jgi:hypothetical protein